MAHASQSKVAAAIRGASDHDSIAVEAAGPAVNGSVTHATRINQSKGGRARTTPFATRAPAWSTRRDRPYSTGP